MTPFSSLAVILLLSIFQDAETNNQSKQKIFYSMPSYRFYSPPGSRDDLGTYPCESAQHGTMICLSVQSCCCFVFKKNRNPSCKLYSFLPEYGSSLEYDSNYQLYYSLEDHKHSWIQVFESVAGTSRNPYELYNSPLSGVWKASNNYSLSVFKSSLIENWASLHVQEVKFVLEQDNQIVVSMIFDGKQSNKMNWFCLNRLIKSSPWTDLKTNKPSIFSIIGEDSIYKRRFYINKEYGRCKKDVGWLLVRDDKKGMVCSFAASKFPIFLFSPVKTSTYLEEYDSADKIIISIKIR